MSTPSLEPAGRRRRRDLAAVVAYLGALAAGWAAMLAVDLPGHLTLDSLFELYEGRFRVRQSWAPSFYAWVLGVFDRLSAGTGLYVVASGALLWIALGSFVWLRRGRASFLAAGLALAFAASPLLLIYQGIVWKDVLFANAAVAGMTALAWAVRDPGTLAAKRWPAFAIALLLLAAAALLRQNGVVVAVAAAAAVGWILGRRGRWGRGFACGLGALAAVVVVSHAMDLATRPPKSATGGLGLTTAADAPAGGGMAQGLRVLQGYDILGALTAEPNLALPAMTAADADAVATLRRLAARFYSAERTDFTDAQPALHEALSEFPDAALTSDWGRLIAQRPGLYLRQRTAVFDWVFLTPRIERCLPVALGVQGPKDVIADLGLTWRWSKADERLLKYDRALLGGPVHSHPAYALLALAVALVLLRRGEPADIVMAALMVGALGFAASFYLISIACDYRYLYFLDLAAMAGALYVALDPPWVRPKRKVGAAA